MSSKNKVNPDHYKVAGRDRHNDDVARGRVKSNLAGDADLKRIPKPGPKPAPKPKAAESNAEKPESEETP